MDKLKLLYKRVYGEMPHKISPLNGAGSNRSYYRLYPQSDEKSSVIGVIGTSAEENRAFYNLSLLFQSRHLSVPAVYEIDDDGMRYIQQDLGNTSLYDMLKEGRDKDGIYDEFEKQMVRRVISELPSLQMEMSSEQVYNQCYPMKEMDRRSIMFDLNYFKYCYLKLKVCDFNELCLQQDFEIFADDLLSVKECGFQYRDFQARNVMLFEGKPFYIDFQGGRRGPLHYDVVSFLWQASSRFSEEFRDEMIDVYVDSLQYYMSVDRNVFKSELQKFVLFRLLQVLGAYGFRGLWEKKQHFIDSIPLALDNLRCIVEMGECDKYPYLKQLLKILYNQTVSNVKSKDGINVAQELLKNDHSYFNNTDNPLVVRVFSFSYKKGIPDDSSGNGGGYVFDCRSTHNPGRYEQYKQLTGLDAPVIDFLEQDGEILNFMDSVYKLADFHVNRFIQRGFTDLMFSFGCTGGQHRSVYCAQHLAEHLNTKYGVEIHIFHREQNISQILPTIPNIKI